MASQVNPNTIDITYPVAGQDNNSQGFRDNFTNIQNNFQTVKDEISDLHAKVLVSTPLNGVAVNNNMNGNVIYNPTFAGNITFGAGSIASTSYAYHALAANNVLNVNVHVKTFYIDNVSGSENLLSNLAIVLPEPGASVPDGSIIGIGTIAPITSVVWTTSSGGSGKIKNVNTSDLQTKGTTIRFQHVAIGASTYWVKAP